jgi:urease gamma subunit
MNSTWTAIAVGDLVWRRLRALVLIYNLVLNGIRCGQRVSNYRGCDLPDDPGHQSGKTEECCDEEVVGSDDDWDDDWDVQCWGWREDPHRFDIEIPMQLGQETGLASPEALHQIQETIGYAHEEDTKITALVLDKNNSVAEATSRGLMLGHQTPLALGLYAIEELCASNKRAQKVIAYEHKQIKRNEAVMDRIRTELEESVVNSKIYDGLRQKYLESSKDLSDLRQKQEREFASSGLIQSNRHGPGPQQCCRPGTPWQYCATLQGFCCPSQRLRQPAASYPRQAWHPR